jgi:AcrR family transcriptional regulator
MQARIAAATETGNRIVEAARELHATRGIVGTSYEEIAHAAGTSTATVYRHFPSLADLLPACARSVQVLQPLTPGGAQAIFLGIETVEERLELLVRGTCECYERDGGWLGAARGEEQLVAALREIASLQTRNLRVMVDAVFLESRASERTRRRIAALIDFPVWQALRAAGFTEPEAAEEMLQLVLDQLNRS